MPAGSAAVLPIKLAAPSANRRNRARGLGPDCFEQPVPRRGVADGEADHDRSDDANPETTRHGIPSRCEQR